MGRGLDVVLGAANVPLVAAPLGASAFEKFIWLHVSEVQIDVGDMKLALIRRVTSGVGSCGLIPLPSSFAYWDFPSD